MDKQYMFKAKKYYRMTLAGSPAIEGELILEDGEKIKKAYFSFPLSGISISRSFYDMLKLKDISYIYYSDLSKVEFSKAKNTIDFYQRQKGIVLRIICPSKFYERLKDVFLHDSYLDSDCIQLVE